MRLAVFLLSLGLVLLIGTNPIHASEQHSSCRYAHLHLLLQAPPQLQSQAIDETNPGCHPELAEGGQEEAAAYFVTDAEDEDNNDFFARKYKVIASYYPPLTSFFIEPGYNSSKAASTFSGAVSYKYIVQRVLRV